MTTTWHMWTRISTGRHTHRYQDAGPCTLTDIPLNSIRASLQHPSPTRLIFLHADSKPPPPTTLPHPTTQPSLPRYLPSLVPADEIQTFISNHHMDTQWPIQHLTFSSQNTILPHSIHTGNLKIVSDGSWQSPHSLLSNTRPLKTMIAWLHDPSDA